MKNHFPNWLFGLLLLIIGGIIFFYTVKYGDLAALNEQKLNSVKYQKLLNQQTKLKYIYNHNKSYDLYLKTVYVMYLDSNLVPQHKQFSLDETIQKNEQYDLTKMKWGSEQWNGECLFAVVEFHKSTDGKDTGETEYLTRKGSEISIQNFSFKIE